MPFETTDILTVDALSIYAAGVLDRDCAFPITNLRKHGKFDQWINSIPVFMQRWADDTVVPAFVSQSINIDTSVIVDTDCDPAEVSGAVTSCDFIMPNMKQVMLASPQLKFTKLMEVVCRQRNVAPQNAPIGSLFDSGGNFISGSPYAEDFARIAAGHLSPAARAIITEGATRGDEADAFMVDGILTQIENGWGDGDNECGDALNIANTINWKELTTESEPFTGTALPDDVTVAGKTITLWGETIDVPVGINLAEFLALFIEKAEAEQVNNAEVEWHMLTPHGHARRILSAATCLQPCGNDSNFDPEVRARWIRDFRSRGVEIQPDGYTFPLVETRKVEANTLWFGPRLIGGNPTYGVFFWNMAAYLASLGVNIADYYNEAFGFADTDALWDDQNLNYLAENFEQQTIYMNIFKTAIDCGHIEMMFKYGALAVARHLWLIITNVGAVTFVNPAVNEEVSIDGTLIGA